MELNITKKDKNALFEREDITFKLTHTGPTPTRTEIKELLAIKTGGSVETIAIISINSEFGRDNAIGVAHTYKTKKDLEKREPKHIIKRNTPKPKKEEPKSEAPAEAPVTIAPVEAKKDTTEQSSAVPSEKSEGEPKAEEKKPVTEAKK
jgi:small subunit ribosomal protein S24e